MVTRTLKSIFRAPFDSEDMEKTRRKDILKPPSQACHFEALTRPRILFSTLFASPCNPDVSPMPTLLGATWLADLLGEPQLKHLQSSDYWEETVKTVNSKPTISPSRRHQIDATDSRIAT